MTDKEIGVLGGGQLGRMLCLSAYELNLPLNFLDKSKDFPAGQVSNKFVEGDFRVYEDVIDFGQNMDILTIEIENVNTEALKFLESTGKKVYPQPSVIEIIKDKGLQKQFFHERGLPVPAFKLCDHKSDVLAKLEMREINIPFFQKSRTEGYDGRGVLNVDSKEKLDLLMDQPCLIEEPVQILKEIAIIAARNERGDIAIYPPTEMVFNPDANLLDLQITPAGIERSLLLEAEELALAVTKSLNIIGLLAIELFLDLNNNWYINEVAPRPHNSGHHTIEAHECSQFEQHLRCILGYPLGSTALLSPSIMVNLLGSPGHKGIPKYIGVEDCLSMKGVHLHLYGKKETRPFRKMGHITIMGDDLESALEKANFVKEHLKVIS